MSWAAVHFQQLGTHPDYNSLINYLPFPCTVISGRIIPQPDYLWASMTDGGWSKLDMDMAISQINVILRLITSLNDKYSAGQL